MLYARYMDVSVITRDDCILHVMADYSEEQQHQQARVLHEGNFEGEAYSKTQLPVQINERCAMYKVITVQ